MLSLQSYQDILSYDLMKSGRLSNRTFCLKKAPVHFRQMLSHDIASFPYLIISFKGKYFSVRESLCSVITRILSIAFAPEFSRFHEFPQRAFD